MRIRRNLGVDQTGSGSGAAGALQMIQDKFHAHGVITPPHDRAPPAKSSIVRQEKHEAVWKIFWIIDLQARSGARDVNNPTVLHIRKIVGSQPGEGIYNSTPTSPMILTHSRLMDC
jgi:hypothetical protein